MIRNYFVIALRNIFKNKLFSFINVFGLALSMSVGLILIFVMTDFIRSDKFNEKKDRIYRIITHASGNYHDYTFATSPKSVADELVNSYSGVDKYVLMTRGSGMIVYNQNHIDAEGLYASSDFFDVFSYQLEAGNYDKILLEPYSIVLSKDLAEKLFMNENPVGKTIKFENLGDFKITGVVDSKKQRSHFNFEMLISYSTIKSFSKEQYENINSWTNYLQNYSYLLLHEDVEPHSIVQNLKEINNNRYDEKNSTELDFELQALTKISTGYIEANEIGLTMPFFVFYIFGFITFIVILLAVFNYTNLNIAKYLSRAREVGLRKIMGASKRKIIMQYLTESIIISLFSMLLACLLVEIILPENIMLDPDKSDMMGFPRSFTAYLVFFIFSLFVGFFAGFFPSVYLASFKPLMALKGVIRTKGYAGFNWRKVLLTMQFIISIIFVLFTVLLLRQSEDMKHKDLGFEKENKIEIMTQGIDYQLLINELKGHPFINNIAASSSVPCLDGSSSSFYQHPVTSDTVNVKDIFVDHNYINTMGMEILAGRDFLESDGGVTENSVIITEKASKYFGFEHPIDAMGKTIRVPTRLKRTEKKSPIHSLNIIGVCNDFYYVSPIDAVAPVVLRYIPEYMSRLIVDFNPSGRNELYSFIDQKWYEIEKNHPPRYAVIEEKMEVVMGMFDSFFGIIGYISLLSITIACMGLLGIISFNIQSRTKEIGIRKVMGANAAKIIFTLSKDFLIIILISLIIALPIVAFVAIQIKMMLAEFIGFDPISIISGLLIIIGLVIIIIATQTIKAVNSNPIDALRYE